MTTPDPAGRDADRSHDQPGSGPPRDDAGPPPPDWSTPDTPVVAPRLGGDPTPPGSGLPPHSGPVPPSPGAAAPYGSDPTGYPGAPPPPGAGAPPPTGPAPPRSNQLALILGIIAALLFCCCTAAAVALLTWGRAVFDEMQERGPRTVGLNQPARDGNLEFRVRQVDCGIGRIGDPVVHQRATGQFCLVEVTVRNVGKRPTAFRESLQKAYGPGRQQFRADIGAGLLANADHQVFLDELNPGAEVTGTVVYDIPPDSRIVRLQLHSAHGSRGVSVRTE